MAPARRSRLLAAARTGPMSLGSPSTAPRYCRSLLSVGNPRAERRSSPLTACVRFRGGRGVSSAGPCSASTGGGARPGAAVASPSVSVRGAACVIAAAMWWPACRGMWLAKTSFATSSLARCVPVLRPLHTRWCWLAPPEASAMRSYCRSVAVAARETQPPSASLPSCGGAGSPPCATGRGSGTLGPQARRSMSENCPRSMRLQTVASPVDSSNARSRYQKPVFVVGNWRRSRMREAPSGA